MKKTNTLKAKCIRIIVWLNSQTNLIKLINWETNVKEIEVQMYFTLQKLYKAKKKRSILVSSIIPITPYIFQMKIYIMYTWIKFRRLIFLNEFHNFVPGHNSITIVDITFQINRNKKANEWVKYLNFSYFLS